MVPGHDDGPPSDETKLLQAQTLLNAKGFGKDITISFGFGKKLLNSFQIHFELLQRTFALKIDEKDRLNHLTLPQPGETVGPVQMNLWLKVFMVISSVFGVPITEITMETTIGSFLDGCTYALWVADDGVLTLDGPKNVEICFKTGGFTSVPLEVQVDYSSVRVASGIDITLPSRSSIPQVVAVAKNFFQQYKVASQPGPQNSRFVVIDAYGLNDAVLVGEKRWETIRFCISDISSPSDTDLRLLIVSDGYYASGIGGPPPITAYSNSLEPAYRKQLEDFTSAFGQYIRTNIGKR